MPVCSHHSIIAVTLRYRVGSQDVRHNTAAKATLLELFIDRVLLLTTALVRHHSLGLLQET